MEQASENPAYWSATQQSEALRNRSISAVELLDCSIKRIETVDQRLNAVVVRDFERARAAAVQADELLKVRDARPLLGVPVTVKESFNVVGLPTTWGFPQAKGFVPAQDAAAVQRLKAAGAIVIGKTNIPTGISDWQSFNAVYGTTNNPWDESRSPGGSSGGSAVALAAGYVALELGSDLRGSLRVPAHYCGVYAHKPTHGLIPLRGHVPPGAESLPTSPDMAVAGPLARCTDDLRLAMSLLAGPDRPDDAGYRLDLPAARHTRLQDCRILVLTEHPLIATSAEITAALSQTADQLTAAGASVYRASHALPDMTQTSAIYTKLFRSLSASFWPLEVYDRVKKIASSIPADVNTSSAQRARAAILSHRDWIAADRIRASLRQRWQDLFREFDVVLLPTMPTTAPLHDHFADQEGRRIFVDGTQISYEDQDPWLTIASMCGLPSTAAPIARSSSGLPIGMQILGPHMGDITTIGFAGLIEREFGGFSAPPNVMFP
jgi:amidase